MTSAPMITGADLPPPDYIDSIPEDDPTLRVPVIIHYDDWATGSGANDQLTPDENLPAPPAELLKEDDEAFPEPPPDYDENIPDEIKYPGLIPPHKLPNPVLESNDRRQIHKDLKFNAKHGINVLDQKNELQKEMTRRKTVKQKKDDAEHQKNNRSSLEQKLDLQKEKLDQREREESILEVQETNQSELAKIHSKIRTKAIE